MHFFGKVHGFIKINLSYYPKDSFFENATISLWFVGIFFAFDTRFSKTFYNSKYIFLKKFGVFTMICLKKFSLNNRFCKTFYNPKDTFLEKTTPYTM